MQKQRYEDRADRARSLPGVRSEGQRYAGLAELAAVLADVDDLEQLGEAYFALSRRVIDFPMSAVYLFVDGTTSPSWYASRNVSNRFLAAYERLGRSVDDELRQVMTTASPAYNLAGRSLQQWRQTDIYRLVDRLENMLHVLKAPIVVHGSIIGTIDFSSDRANTPVAETDLHFLSALAGVVGGAVTALRGRQRLQEQLNVVSLALENSSAAVAYTSLDSTEPTVTPPAAALLDDLREGGDILYQILRDTEPSAAESRLSYLVRKRDGANDVLNCTVRSVPGQPGAEVMELSLESAEPRHVNQGRPSLSNRESDVARMVAAGLSDREIAEHLRLSVYTVRQHVKSIYTKLEICSRVQLTRVFFGKTARAEPPRH
ncbi:LuxR C-terminal-related transcriptional regulator [Streptomyces sp. NBC_01373]|uniref:LuxR C-terminal-related transcriptional regulator n=1 Tax=Streptomyces sp. NBC_01373 TaxID=2903843 RepID=UPI002251E8F4|nr:LuxR C-terminal-related transcriptional regulator [Streptomyces sp. NBC_01373]MCX4703171.1 LuxR C-terminal-related transcriptional regulator [Streptomyces sp. NBC_01373]